MRRGVVARHLTDDYRLPKSFGIKALLGSASRERCANVSVANLRSDVAMLRIAYRYLTGSDEERMRIVSRAKKGDPMAAVVLCLQRDGIERWEQIKIPIEMPAPARQSSKSEAAVQPAPDSEKPQAILAIPSGEVSAIAQAAGLLVREYEAMTLRLRQMETNLQELRDENKDLRDRVLSLEERLEGVKTTRLAELAREFPQFPELFRVAEKIRLTKATGEKQATPESLDLPLKAAGWHGGVPIVYEKKFLEAVAGFPNGEHSQTVKAIRLLINHGPQHQSLSVKRLKFDLNGAPQGAFVMRGSHELRIAFQKTTDKLVVYWVERRGNLPREYGSEA